MFLRSIPTSKVTPSPKRRFEAATYPSWLRQAHAFEKITHLEGILLLRKVDRTRVLAQLVENPGVRSARSAAMARASCVLRRADKPLDEVPSRCYRHLVSKMEEKCGERPAKAKTLTG